MVINNETQTKLNAWYNWRHYLMPRYDIHTSNWDAKLLIKHYYKYVNPGFFLLVMKLKLMKCSYVP